MSSILALQTIEPVVCPPEPTGDSNLSIACTGHSSISYNCG